MCRLVVLTAWIRFAIRLDQEWLEHPLEVEALAMDGTGLFASFHCFLILLLQ